MERWTPKPPDRLLAGLAGLADPTRLRLLAVLERHELGVAELTEVLRLPQSTVSRHLKVLADSGFLGARADGTSRTTASRSSSPAPAASGAPRARAPRAGPRSSRIGSGSTAASWPAATRPTGSSPARPATGSGSAPSSTARGSSPRPSLALLPKDLVVADLGCGTGDLTARLARRVAHVHAVDRSAAMLRAARRRVEALGNVSLHEADLEDLPLEDASCDAALLALVLGWTPDPRPVLAEAARVLRPGGTVVVIDLARHDDERFQERLGQARAGFDPADLATLLSAAGLASAQVCPLPPEPGARGPALLSASAERPVPVGARPRAGRPRAA